jgi:hypothetical protein
MKIPVRHTPAHVLVRSTAIEMAGALYDEVMRDNKINELWQLAYPATDPKAREAAFLTAFWPKLCDRARATLAGMLTTNMPEDLKETIHDALVKDAEFVHVRRKAEARWRKKHGFGLPL